MSQSRKRKTLTVATIKDYQNYYHLMSQNRTEVKRFVLFKCEPGEISQFDIIINTELVAKFQATAFVPHLAEHCTRFVGSQIRFPAGGQSCIFRN